MLLEFKRHINKISTGPFHKKSPLNRISLLVVLQ